MNEDEVLGIYKKLRSIPKTAIYFGCCRTPIERILKINNILKYRSKVDLNEGEVIETYKELRSAKKVAKQFNCSITPIYKIIKKIIINKKCKSCGKEYINSDFHRKSFCSKKCYHKYLKDWRFNNPDYHKDWKERNPNYMGEWWINHKGYLRGWFQDNWDEFYKRNRKKILAGNLSYKYIKIPKGHKCEICKINLATQRHHEDYDKPFEVILCCKSCHGVLDRERHLKEMVIQ